MPEPQPPGRRVILRLRERALDLGARAHGRPERDARLVLGRAAPKVPDELAERGRALVAAGAAIVTSAGNPAHGHRGGASGGGGGARRAARRAVGGGGRARLDRHLAAPVARRALAAGAAMINDVSGLADPELAGACAETGAALVITHTRTPPKTKAFPAYDDVVEESPRSSASVLSWPAPRASARSASCSTRHRPREDARRVRGAAALAARLADAACRCCSPCRARTSSARSPGGRRRRATRARWPRSAQACAAAPDPARARRGGRADYLSVHAALESGAERTLELAEGLRREEL